MANTNQLLGLKSFNPVNSRQRAATLINSGGSDDHIQNCCATV